MGILVVVLGVLVLVVAVVALREPNGHVSAVQTAHTSASSVAKDSSTHPKKTTSSAPPPSQASSTSPPAPQRTPLIVLNNTTIPHLAEQAAQRFEAGGWTVTHFDNYQNDILSTCAYYDPSASGAKAAAQALQAQYPTIRRVKPKFAGLPSGPVVVILTPDYTAS